MKVKKFNESLRDKMNPVSDEEIWDIVKSESRYDTIYNILDYLRESGQDGGDMDHSDLMEIVLDNMEEEEFKKLVLLTLNKLVK